MNQQRKIIYAERMKVLKGEDVHQQVLKYIPDYVATVVRGAVNADDMPEKWNEDDLNAAIERRLIPVGTNYVTREKLEKWDYDIAIRRISKKTEEFYEEKIKRIQEETNMDFGQAERRVLLRVVDTNWIDHIDAMDQLRKGIGLRSYAQTDPVIAYKQEGFAMFDEMIERIQERTIGILLKAEVEVHRPTVTRILPNAVPAQAPSAPAPEPNAPAPAPAPAQEERPAASQNIGNVVSTGGVVPTAINVDALKTSGNEKFNPATMKKAKKPGPNDPCPCGSGLKYKKCHGRPF